MLTHLHIAVHAEPNEPLIVPRNSVVTGKYRLVLEAIVFNLVSNFQGCRFLYRLPSETLCLINVQNVISTTSITS